MISKLQALIIAAVALTAAGAVMVMDQGADQNNGVGQSNESDFNDGTFYYEITSDTDLTVSIVAPDSGKYQSQSALVVPATVTNDSKTYRVTQIADQAFKNTSMLNAIDLSQATNLVSIGKDAFNNSQIYCNVALPASVTTLGESCFQKATITGIDMSAATGLTVIPESAFTSCTLLKTVSLPSSITEIKDKAFASCSQIKTFTMPSAQIQFGHDILQSSGSGLELTLPAEVTQFYEDTFESAKVAKYIQTTAEDSSLVKVVDECVLSKDGKILYAYPLQNDRISFEVPAGVEELGTNAFYGASKLIYLTVDNFVTMGEYSLSMTNISHLTVTATAATGSNDGIIKTYFTQENGYWIITNTNIKFLTIDTDQALDLTGMTQKGGQNQHVDFTDRSVNTTGGDFQGADARAGNRFSVTAESGTVTTTFNYDNTRIVAASQDPSKWGTVSGAGNYELGASVTLTATANTGSKFDKWVDEEGTTVSTDATYTFTMTKKDVTLTALFVPYKNTTVTVPTDQTFQLTKYLGGSPENQKPSSYNYYTFQNVAFDEKKDNGDGTTTYTYSLYNGVHAAIVTGKVGGKDIVTFKELFTKKDTAMAITITQDQLLPEGKSWDTVDRSLSNKLGNDFGDILVSANKQNSIYMKTGDANKRDMMVYRSWQAVGNTMQNPFLEPELVVEITKIDGTAVTDELVFHQNDTTKGNELTGYFVANTEGTYIATFYQKAFTMNYGSGGDVFFGATWPELTDVVVVNVTGTGQAPALDSGMTIYDEGMKADRPIDSEIDAFYYIYGKDDGYTFTFTPSASVTSVNVYNPTIKDHDTPGITGFTKVAGTSASGEWTVLLKEGRNIVEISDGTNTVYQVLTAIPVKVTVNGLDINDPAAGFKQGQNNTVVFLNPYNDSIGGIYNLKSKLAGLYNSGATIFYAYENGDRVQTAKQPGYGHWFFMTQMQYQTLTVTVPETATIGSDFTIYGHGVVMSGFDGTAGDHRTWYTAGGTSLGVNRASQFPEITLKVINSYGARLSTDGGQTWTNYDTFALAIEAAEDGNIIELGSVQDAARIDKAIEVHLDGFSLKTATDKPLVIASAVTFKGAPAVENSVYIRFENGSFLATDTNFFMTQSFSNITAWADKTFASGFNTNEVSVRYAGYTQYIAEDGKMGICHVTDMPFAVWVEDRTEFVFFGTIEEALATGTNYVYLLSYVPLYDGGSTVYEYTIEETITDDVTLETVYRVTDGTVSTFYVGGLKYYSNGSYDLALPQGANYVTVDGTIYVDEGIVLTVGDMRILADVYLDGGYDGEYTDPLAEVWLQNRISDYKIHIGFVNIDNWYTEVQTDTGHIYKMKDGCNYEFIRSSSSLVDRVAVIHSGFKADLSDDARTASLACSQEMVAYTYINGVPVGYSNMYDAIEQAKEMMQEEVYFTYYTNSQDPSANIYVQEINWDIDYDSLGLKLRTIHQASDGTESKYVVDDSRVILRFSEGRAMSTSKDIDLTSVLIDGTLVMKGSSVATFASENTDLGAETAVVTLDLSGHETGLVAKGISGITYKTVLPEGSGGKAYETVVKDDNLYLQLQSEEDGGNNVAIFLATAIAILVLLGVAAASIVRPKKE